MPTNSVRFLQTMFILGIAVVAFPRITKADLGETIVLQNNTAINLDTGALTSSGGDVLFTAAGLVPQGSAKAKALGSPGYNFPFLTKAAIQLQAASASTATIAASQLTTGRVFMVVTNGGNLAKGLIIANFGTSLWVSIGTFGVNPPAGQPLVSGVANNSSGVGFGFPNSGVTPSGIVVITGSNLSDPGVPVLQSSASPGLPLTLNGTSISVTVSGVTTHPALYYASPTQLAAVLPATSPIGNGALTVTYHGQTSAPMPLQVVAASLGINTYNGLGVITDAITGALLTYTNSAKPNDIVTIWATGLGADAADSDSVYASPPHAVNTSLQIYIGTIPATILYQGSAGFPGLNQINVVIPPNAPTGCWVSVTAVAGGIAANSVSIPIQPGGGDCKDVESGLTGSQIAPPSTAKTGFVSLLHSETPNNKGGVSVDNAASASFVKYTGVYIPTNNLSPNSCILFGPASTIPTVTPGLDTGGITLTGPDGTATKLSSFARGVWASNLSTTAIPESGGTFTFQSAGGTDIPQFTLNMNLSPLLQWTSQAQTANVDEGQALFVSWTGGNPGTYVLITGAVVAPLGIETFQCKAPVNGLGFQVPSYILRGIPAGAGSTIVQNDIWFPLPASGLDISTAAATVSYQVNSTYVAAPPVNDPGGGGAR